MVILTAITVKLRNKKYSESSALQVSEIILEKTNTDDSRDTTCYDPQTMQEMVSKAESFGEVEKQNLYELLLNYHELFFEQPGRVRHYQHSIKMQDTEPFFIKSYFMPYVFREEVEQQIQEMLDWVVISRCHTEYVSPVVVVQKKGWHAACLSRCAPFKRKNRKGPCYSA